MPRWTIFLMILVISLALEPVTDAQNTTPTFISVTKQKITDYKADIEFDVLSPLAGVFTFELVLAKMVCNINFKAPAANLNGTKLAPIMASDHKTFRFSTRATDLRQQGNKLVADSGSCQLGDHRLGLVRGLELVVPPGTTTSQLGG